MRPDLEEFNQYIVDYVASDGVSKWQSFYIPKCHKPRPIQVVLLLTEQIKEDGGAISSIFELTDYHYGEIHEKLMARQAEYEKYIRPLFVDYGAIRKSMAN